MAYLDENATWEQGIYQWETQDPVVGGPDGIDNVPTRQLANRTGYLKEQIAAHAAATDPHPQYTTESEVHALVEVTQAQFDSTKKPASTEFVQRALGSYRGTKTYTGTATLTVNDIGYLIECQTTSAITLTLPAAGLAGSQVTIVNTGAGSVTVNTPTGGIFYGTGLATANLPSVIVPVGVLNHFVWDGSNYVMEGAPYTSTTGQFNVSGRIPNTAWVQQALGNRSACKLVAPSATMDIADWGKFIGINTSTSGQTYTLVAPSLTGAQVQLQNYGTADVSVAVPSGQLIYSGGAAASQNLPAGGQCTITYAGGNYFIEGTLAPTPSQFDNSNRLATTAFVQQALGNRSACLAVSATTTLDPSYWGGLIPVNCSAASQIITLPSAALAGLQMQFQNWGSYDVSITTPTGVLITSGGNAATQTLPAGSTCTITWDGVNYFMEGVLVGTPPQFANGYRIANTAFVQQALGNYRAGAVISGTVVLTASQAGGVYSCNGGTITLPAFSSVSKGTSFTIQAASQTTVNLTGSDTLWKTPGHLSSLTLYAGDWIIVAAVGEWEVVAGSMTGGTAAQFDSSLRTASTAFVQRALGNRQAVLGVQTSQTLPASIMGGYVILNDGTSSLTVTLPSTGLVPGAEILVGNSTAYDSVFSTGTSAAFYGAGIPWLTTYTIRSGTFCVMTWDGGNWLVTASDTSTNPATTDNSNRIATTYWVRSAIANIVSGSFLSSLAAAAGFAFSASTNGYLKFPSWLGGLVLQWGNTAVMAVDAATRVTFPVTFPNACFQVLVSGDRNLVNYSGAGQYGFTTYDLTTTGFTCANDADQSAARFFAIGY